MVAKRKINIQLSPKEAALVHYEMEFGRNGTIKAKGGFCFTPIKGQKRKTKYCII